MTFNRSLLDVNSEIRKINDIPYGAIDHQPYRGHMLVLVQHSASGDLYQRRPIYGTSIRSQMWDAECMSGYCVHYFCFLFVLLLSLGGAIFLLEKDTTWMKRKEPMNYTESTTARHLEVSLWRFYATIYDNIDDDDVMDDDFTVDDDILDDGLFDDDLFDDDSPYLNQGYRVCLGLERNPQYHSFEKSWKAARTFTILLLILSVATLGIHCREVRTVICRHPTLEQLNKNLKIFHLTFFLMWICWLVCAIIGYAVASKLPHDYEATKQFIEITSFNLVLIPLFRLCMGVCNRE